MKAVAPDSVVLGGSIAFDDERFLRGIYAAGAKGSFAGLGLHPYSRMQRRHDPEEEMRRLRASVETLQRVAAEHGESALPIWITKLGWSAVEVGDASRAAYLRAAVEEVRALRNVEAFCIYTLQRTDNEEYGLLAHDGAETLSWRAYVDALARR